ENGEKIFWARGNGWVLAGLARVLTHLPKDDPRYNDYVAIFKEMSAKLAEIQGLDGMWRTSLIDHEEYPMPETSGTAFFTYALAWGINNGLLDRNDVMPVVDKGWKSLNQVIYPSGRVGWVQHQAAAPGMIAPEMSREYAPGAYLLAASEMLRMNVGKGE